MDAHRLLVRESGIDMDGWNQVVHVPHEDYFPVLAYVGRLIESKGILLLLESVRNLKVTYPQIHLFVAGGGQDEDRVRRMISEYGLYMGQVSFAWQYQSWCHEESVSVGGCPRQSFRSSRRFADNPPGSGVFGFGDRDDRCQRSAWAFSKRIFSSDSGAGKCERSWTGHRETLELSRLRKRLGERARKEISEVFCGEEIRCVLWSDLAVNFVPGISHHSCLLGSSAFICSLGGLYLLVDKMNISYSVGYRHYFFCGKFLFFPFEQVFHFSDGKCPSSPWDGTVLRNNGVEFSPNLVSMFFAGGARCVVYCSQGITAFLMVWYNFSWSYSWGFSKGYLGCYGVLR